MQGRLSISEGRAAPLGATPDEGGVNFAVFSAHATRMVLCLYDTDGRETRIDLPEREGDVWHGHVAGLGVGQNYGFRAYGPYRPDEGHRFNPNKLLMDPYARQLTGHPVWDDALFGFTPGHALEDLSFDPRDSAPFMPRSVVAPGHWPHDPRRSDRKLSETVIYEAHVKGLTQRHPEISAPGTIAAAASDPILDHLTRLGVTAIEFLPLQAFINDRFLVEKGLTNYWGYQPWGYFAPDPRYLAGGDIFEMRHMVDRFHGAGIEVILDVVYNHTGEGGHLGPTLSFRGLDNASYYRLAPGGRRYIDETGTGNTLRCDHPMVLRLVMDSLRYWVTVMGVDGFRFDLAATLGRTGDGAFDRNAPLFMAMRQDPVLSRVKLIAEPWDIGPGGYQLGGFTAPFVSWNDKFRDGVRRFWRGDPGRAGDLAARITGSAVQFDHSGRRATSSVNFLTAHDGFTLEDVVSYRKRHNEANGEQGRDGHGENFSDNLGVEGPTTDPGIRAARDRRKRNMIATLLLSQGTPMILAGDELGHTQGGNNNAYNQDNETAWINWENADPRFHRFVRRMIAFRRDHPVLRQSRFLHSRERALDGLEDIFWRRPDGLPMQEADWDDPETHCICVELRTASGTPHYGALEYAVFAVLNAGNAQVVTVPDPPPGSVWSKRIDTAEPDSPATLCDGGLVTVAADSVAIFTLDPAD
ncbi:MAG: glycogen debranching protein GlgX [Pseudomonadota bacterium]